MRELGSVSLFLTELRLLPAVLDSPSQLLRKFGGRIARGALATLQRLGSAKPAPTSIHLLATESAVPDRAEIARRISFYARAIPKVEIVEETTVGWDDLWSREPLLLMGAPRSWIESLCRLRPGAFDVDFRRNPLDGWAWTDLAEYLAPVAADIEASRRRFTARVAELRAEGRPRAYVFGTGPSLQKARARSWDDGYRVVCNTIVRDTELWDQLDPDFIVAGDAIYHFGFTAFARAFRRDLRARLQHSRTYFVYPSRFDAIVLNELDDLRDQLVPIPAGWRRRIDVDLSRVYRLPGLGNVLGLLLLPLACTLSKQVALWGFDGRAPTDQLFWSNSPRHTYPEHTKELKQAHPSFFEHFVPESDPTRYVRAVHGDRLDACLELAEARGFQFEMLHSSWTPALRKRYSGTEQPG